MSRGDVAVSVRSTNQDSTTTIRLLGAVQAEITGRRVEHKLPGSKGRLLFVFLALNRDKPVSRDVLIEALWPSKKPASPDGALSTLLTRLRRAIGPAHLLGRATLRLALPDDAVIDVEAGRAHLEAARAAADPAVALPMARLAYQELSGPLLPEAANDWIEDQRRNLAGDAVVALEVAAEAALALGGAAVVDARAAARTLIEREPFLESGYVLLMQALAQKGNQAEALRVFERLRVLLRDELGASPSSVVLRLHEQVLRSDPAVVDAAPIEPPRLESSLPLPPGLAAPPPLFVGRRDESDALEARWDDVKAGRQALALVYGEPGIGKSALAAMFAQRVHASGAAVLHGQCDEYSVVPYQPITQALRYFCRRSPATVEALAPRIAGAGRLIPELRDQLPDAGLPATGDDDAERYRLFEAVTTMLHYIALNRPLLLALDDLHWADRSTLLMLRHVVRESDRHPIMVLVTYRDTDVTPEHPLHDTFADLARDRPSERLALSGLAQPEIAELIESYTGSVPSATLTARWHARTEGHPFFLSEALRRADLQDIATWREGVLPESVSDLIMRRVSRLAPGCAAQLSLASVFGREFDLGVLATLTEHSVEATLGALEEAIQHGLLIEDSEDEDRFRFRHVLIREALYAQFSRSRRVRLHARVAEALERTARPAAELAYHFYLARRVVGTEKAFRYSLSAAAAAFDALAYEEASVHYQRALDVIDAGSPQAEGERCRLLLRLGDAQRRAGDPAVESTFESIARSARARGDAVQLALAALGGRHYESGEPDDARVRLLEEALEGLGHSDSVLRVRVSARLVEGLHFAGEGDGAVALSNEAMDAARRLADPDAIIAALLGRHAALLHIEHVDQRLAVLEELIRLAEVTGNRELATHGHQWSIYGRFEIGDMEGVEREHRAFAALVAELRQPRYEHVGLAWTCLFAQLHGSLEAAEQLAQDGFALAAQVQGLDPMALFAAQLFFFRRDQGRLGELVALIEDFVASHDVERWRSVLALSYAATGQSDRARELLARFEREGLDGIPRDLWWLTTLALLAEACELTRGAVPARPLYELLAPYQDRSVQVVFAAHLGSVQRCLGLLAAAMGELERAAAHFESALQRHRAMNARALTVRTCVEYRRAVLLSGGPRDRSRAARLMEEALELAGGTDLEPLVR